MTEFSIEMAADEIVDQRTKRYFSEVQGCYHSGYYRSAVVMLWSVIVTDLLFKLEQLASAHGDTKAKTILEEIGESRKRNPKSPEWELGYCPNDALLGRWMVGEHRFRELPVRPFVIDRVD